MSVCWCMLMHMWAYVSVCTFVCVHVYVQYKYVCMQNCCIGACVYCVQTSVHVQLKASLSFWYGAEVPVPVSHPALVPSRACTTVVRVSQHSQALLPVASPSSDTSHSIQRGACDDGTSGLSTCGMKTASCTQGWSYTIRVGEGRGCLGNVGLLSPRTLGGEGLAYCNSQC